MKYIKSLKIIILLSFLLVSCDTDYFYIFDIYSFEKYLFTPAWSLSRAVKNNDTERIRYLVLEKGVDVNYQDGNFAQTVLTTAILNGKTDGNGKCHSRIKPETIETLLQVGADPNLICIKEGCNLNYGGNYAIFNAIETNNIEVVRLLLKYGANPNVFRQSYYKGWNKVCTPIVDAIQDIGGIKRKEIVDLLFDAGADIYASSKYFPGGAFNVSIDNKSFHWLLYFLKKGADYNRLFYISTRNGQKKIDILTALRYSLEPLDSREYKYKRKVIEFLKERGLDYDATPIPDDMIEYIKEKYSSNWQEYLEKY